MAIKIGNSGNNILNGTNGSDLLLGMGGNDILNGGSGTDILSGGGGNDTLNGGSGGDLVSGDAGNDTLIYKMSENANRIDLYDGGSGRRSASLVNHAPLFQFVRQQRALHASAPRGV